MTHPTSAEQAQDDDAVQNFVIDDLSTCVLLPLVAVLLGSSPATEARASAN